MTRPKFMSVLPMLLPGLVLTGVLAAVGIVPAWAAAVIAVTFMGGGLALAAAATKPDTPPPSSRRQEPETGASVLAILPEPVMLLDSHRRVLLSNPAAERLFRTQRGADLSLSLRHPDVLAAVDEVLAGKPGLSVEITVPVPVPRSFLLHVIRLPDADAARPPGAVITLHDLTAAKRAEQVRADFVANVSHELRTPLTSLLGFIETLQGSARNDPEAQERFLAIMATEAQRMARIIDDLLSLSRVEIEEHVAPDAPVDIGLLLQGVIAALQVRAQDKGMPLKLDCPADLPAVPGDAHQLHQVFQNLVDNAIKYGRAATPIEVMARALPRLAESGLPGVEIAVRDRGDGIPAAEIPRLTERFYRVDKARSRRMGGTGLGLAIVKHIVSRHRGRLVIESVEGEGSTFAVQLPAAPPDRRPEHVIKS